MLRKRIIPSLLISDEGLIRTQSFKNPTYVGDPINATKIFSEKLADELIILDKSLNMNEPNFQLIEDIAGEAFMPLSYGGAIKNVKQAQALFKLGIEKVILNAAAFNEPSLISNIAEKAGSSSVVVAINVRKMFLSGYQIYSSNGLKKEKIALEEHILDVESRGAGEILVCDIDSEGKQKGLNIELISHLSEFTSVPLLISGGMRNLADAKDAFTAGAAGVVGGDMFTYHGKHRAVLISYPSERDIEGI